MMCGSQLESSSCCTASPRAATQDAETEPGADASALDHVQAVDVQRVPVEVLQRRLQRRAAARARHRPAAAYRRARRGSSCETSARPQRGGGVPARGEDPAKADFGALLRCPRDHRGARRCRPAERQRRRGRSFRDAGGERRGQKRRTSSAACGRGTARADQRRSRSCGSQRGELLGPAHRPRAPTTPRGRGDAPPAEDSARARAPSAR